MASYRRDVAPQNKTFDTTMGGLATEESLGTVDKEVRQQRLRETQPGGAAESIDTVFPHQTGPKSQLSDQVNAPDQAPAPEERRGQSNAQAGVVEERRGKPKSQSSDEAGEPEEKDEQAQTEGTSEDTEKDTTEDTSGDTDEGDTTEDASSGPEEGASEDTSEDTTGDTDGDTDGDNEEDEDLPEGTLNTVGSAKRYVEDAEGEERTARAEAVLAAEQDGKDRSTLVDWLEDELADDEE